MVFRLLFSLLCSRLLRSPGGFLSLFLSLSPLLSLFASASASSLVLFIQLLFLPPIVTSSLLSSLSLSAFYTLLSSIPSHILAFSFSLLYSLSLVPIARSFLSHTPTNPQFTRSVFLLLLVSSPARTLCRTLQFIYLRLCFLLFCFLSRPSPHCPYLLSLSLLLYELCTSQSLREREENEKEKGRASKSWNRVGRVRGSGVSEEKRTVPAGRRKSMCK